MDFCEIDGLKNIRWPNFHCAVAHTFNNDDIKSLKQLLNAHEFFHKSEYLWDAKTGRTLLMHAAKEGKHCVFKHLLKRGYDINAQDSKGHSALYLSINYSQGNIFSYIVNNCEITSENLNRALMLTCKLNQYARVKKLIDMGADVLYTHEHTTALIAGSHSFKIVELLLQRGADNYNELNDIGQTALHKCLYLGYSEESFNTCKILLEAGADPNIKSKNYHSILYAACENGDIKTVELLLEYGADPNIDPSPYIPAILYGCCEIVTLLFNHGANHNHIDSVYRSAHEYAIHKEKFAMASHIKRLIGCRTKSASKR